MAEGFAQHWHRGASPAGKLKLTSQDPTHPLINSTTQPLIHTLTLTRTRSLMERLFHSTLCIQLLDIMFTHHYLHIIVRCTCSCETVSQW